MNKSVDIKRYIGKPIDKILNDFPEKTIRILFPYMAYTQEYNRDRINIVCVNGLITRIWLG